ncbi:MAG: hypothetical protein V5A24_04230 [Haloarculaceae archaeon]
MDESVTSRRNVLKSTAAIATIGTLAGCGSGGGTTTAGGDGGDGEDGGGGSDMPSGSAGQGQRVSAVPAPANALLYFDFRKFRTDEDLKRLLNSGVESTGSAGIEGTLEEEGLADAINPDKIYDMMIFGEIPENDPMQGATSNGGTIVWTGLSSDSVIPALKTKAEEEDSEVTEETYNGQTLLLGESMEGGFGVVSDGVYAFGPEQVVKNAIDVSAGDAESASGSAVDALATTADAPVRFAADLPTGTFTSGDGGSGGSGPMQYTSEIDVIAGSLFYKNGTNVGFQLSATMTSEDVASEGTQMLEQFKQLYSQQADQMEQGSEELKRMLDNLSISQSGKTVTVSYEDTVDNLVQLVQGESPLTGGMGN